MNDSWKLIKVDSTLSPEAMEYLEWVAQRDGICIDEVLNRMVEEEKLKEKEE